MVVKTRVGAGLGNSQCYSSIKKSDHRISFSLNTISKQSVPLVLLIGITKDFRYIIEVPILR